MACSSPRRAALVAGLYVMAAAGLALADAPLENPAIPAVSVPTDGGAPVTPVDPEGATVHISPEVTAAPVATASADDDDDGDDVASPDGGAPGDDDDDTANADEIKTESADLAAMQKAEATATDPGAGAATQLFTAAAQLGGPSALARGLRDALGEARAYQPLLPDAARVDPSVEVAFDIARAKDQYDIPVEMRDEVAQWITFFQHGGRKYFIHWLARSTRYIPVMRDILRQEGLPEDTVFLSMIESGFSTMAYSWAKASGPWQFITGTAKRFGLKEDFWVDERRDPIKSTRAAARYLRQLHDQFGNWYLAWAGYNAGGGKIQKAINKYGTHDFWAICDEGRFLRKETKNYVPKLIAAALVTKHPEQFGFTRAEVPWQAPLESEEVQVVNPTDLAVIAKAANCTLDDIKTLNPELRRWLTPPATKEHPYVLRVPKGHKVAFEKNYPKLAPKERLTFRIVRVRRGDTLSQIARHNHSFPEAIMRMNGLRDARRLRLGTELMVPVQSRAALARIEAEEKSGKRKRGYDPKDEIPAGTPRYAHQVSGTVVHKRVDGKDQVTYGVASGDNLWAIGQRFNVSVAELKTWNHLHGRRPKLQIGEQLILYPRGPVKAVASTATPTAKPLAVQPAAARVTPPLRPSPSSVADRVSMRGKTKRIVHTLAPGDSLWSLSQQYGVSVQALKRLNHVGRHNRLRAGDTLLIEVANNG